MNRMGLGLAIGAGYFLGRTKKLKTAVAVGGLVAGKKLNLSPRMVADLLSQQLRDNPQFKEIGDQLRGDLRGVGKAASGALVERQLDSLADRLHDRTADVRDRLSGVVPQDEDEDEDEEEDEDRAGDKDEDRAEADGDEATDEEARDEEARDEEDRDSAEPEPERPVKKAAAKKAAPAKKSAPAKKAAAKKSAPARRTAAKKAASASRGARSRTAKGGGER